MVRINLIKPEFLADQHLIAEYNEILMLLGYVAKYPLPLRIPPAYLLGPGHIRFFKNKLLYLQYRFELLKTEMKQRSFSPKKTISLKNFPKALKNDFVPRKEDIKIIKQRLVEKLKQKPSFYRYYGEHKPLAFFLDLIKRADQ